MTNYEFYEKEIIEILRRGHGVAVLNEMPKSCSDISCEKCDISNHCVTDLAEWLAKEHCEAEEIRADEMRKFAEWYKK